MDSRLLRQCIFAFKIFGKLVSFWIVSSDDFSFLNAKSLYFTHQTRNSLQIGGRWEIFLRDKAVGQSGRLNKEANQAPSVQYMEKGKGWRFHFLFLSYLPRPSPATRHNERIGASCRSMMALVPVGEFRGQGISFEVPLIRFMTGWIVGLSIETLTFGSIN